MEDGQLDNPYSGRVSAGNYTEVITTKVRGNGQRVVLGRDAEAL